MNSLKKSRIYAVSRNRLVSTLCTSVLHPTRTYKISGSCSSLAVQTTHRTTTSLSCAQRLLRIMLSKTIVLFFLSPLAILATAAPQTGTTTTITAIAPSATTIAQCNTGESLFPFILYNADRVSSR